jgi:hypothetical protein
MTDSDIGETDENQENENNPGNVPKPASSLPEKRKLDVTADDAVTTAYIPKRSKYQRQQQGGSAGAGPPHTGSGLPEAFQRALKSRNRLVWMARDQADNDIVTVNGKAKTKVNSVRSGIVGSDASDGRDRS